MTLAEVEAGKRVRVKAIGGGRGARQQLSGMGVHPGDDLEVVRTAPFHGPVLVEVHGSQVAIGRGLSEKLEVELVTSP